MMFFQYKLFVLERAGLRTEEEAERVIRAVFEVLDEMTPALQAKALAETLPAEMRQYMGKNIWRARYGFGEFVDRLTDKEAGDPARAEIHARAVFSVLAEFLPSPELLAVLDGMPQEIRSLFCCMTKAA
jgi:uncharacterized protein (DUF2267 family)